MSCPDPQNAGDCDEITLKLSSESMQWVKKVLSNDTVHALELYVEDGEVKACLRYKST